MKFGLFRSEIDKVASLILLVCMTIIVSGCAMGVLYLREYKFYSGEKGEYAKSVAVQLYSADDIKFAQDYFLCRETDSIHSEEICDYKNKFYTSRFSLKNTNFIFAVYDVDNTLLFDSLNPENDESAYQTFENPGVETEYRGRSDFYFFDEYEGFSRNLKLRYKIITSEDSSANDRYSSAFRWIDMAYKLRYFVFVVLFVALAVIAFIMTNYVMNAGTVDEETGEIVPGIIDRLPLSIVTVVMVLFFASAKVVYELTEAADTEMVLKNVVVMLSFVMATLLLLLYLSTLSVRRKIYLRKREADESYCEKNL